MAKKLTKTEKIVYKFLCEDCFGYEEVAEKMFISQACVKSHTNNIFKKLKIHSRPELVYKHWKTKFEKLLGIIKKNECKN